MNQATPYLPLAVLAALLVTAVPVAPQSQVNEEGFKFCNAPGYEDLTLVFLNPDLKLQDDGLVHASGAFFIQFQARGEKAFEIDRLIFHFGKEAKGLENCNTPAEWVTEGAFIKNYRSDNDWRDGFFVPINTYNVGDGTYIAGISVYNSAGLEMVRAWTFAIVENGGRKHARDGCPETGAAQPPCPDKNVPWPMVLPGDGERLDGKSGIYIEVAEQVSDIKVYVNGGLATLKNATAPARDDDLVPDLCLTATGLHTSQPQLCDGQVQRRVWGPAWEWDGIVQTEDVVKVIITDLWGNVAQKVLHIGDPTIGGRVSAGAPEFELIVDEAQRETNSEGRAVYNVTVKVTKDFLHGNFFVEHKSGRLPEGVTYKYDSNHVMAAAGEEFTTKLRFFAGPNAKTGTVDFDVVVKYLEGQIEASKTIPIKLTVADKANSTIDEEAANPLGSAAERIRGQDTPLDETAQETAPEESKGLFGIPAPAPLALLVGVAAIALALRRRA